MYIRTYKKQNSKFNQLNVHIQKKLFNVKKFQIFLKKYKK